MVDVQSQGKRNPREDWEEETYQVFLGLGNRSNKKLRNHEEGLFMVITAGGNLEKNQVSCWKSS